MDMKDLSSHVNTQIKNILNTEIDVYPYVEAALRRSQYCFQSSMNKYLVDCNNLNIYNSVWYSTFLYYLSNTAYKEDKNISVAEKIYYLNKILHSVELFYAIELPAVFGMEHPLGSVMGRAAYHDKFFFYQGCTVGASGGVYPQIGYNVLMYSNSKILGNSVIGDNVILAANAYVINATIPSNSIVFGQYPHLNIKHVSQDDITEKTKHIWNNSL